MKNSQKDEMYEQNEIIEKYKKLYAQQENSKFWWTDDKEKIFKTHLKDMKKWLHHLTG